MRTVDARGARVPKLGLGTSGLRERQAREAVERALALGYRHFDTAEAYGNEAMIGAALRASGVPRDDLWITSKVWHDHAEPEALRRAVRDSLRRLGLERLDLLLLHWPSAEVPLERTLEALSAQLDEGTTRRIGVSNFTPTMLRRALELAPVAALQVEYHPYLAQRALHALCVQHDLVFQSYAPLGRGEMLDDPTVTAVAARHGVTPAQAVLAWHVAQRNVVAIPKAAGEAHQRENLAALEVTLDDDAMAALHGLARGRRIFDPPFAPAWENAGR